MANFHGYLRTVFERAELTKSAAIQAQIQHFETVLQNQISLLNRDDPRERIRARGTVCTLEHKDPAIFRTANLEGREVCRHLEHSWNFPPDALPSHKIPLIWGKNQ